MGASLAQYTDPGVALRRARANCKRRAPGVGLTSPGDATRRSEPQRIVLEPPDRNLIIRPDLASIGMPAVPECRRARVVSGNTEVVAVLQLPDRWGV